MKANFVNKLKEVTNVKGEEKLLVLKTLASTSNWCNTEWKNIFEVSSSFGNIIKVEVETDLVSYVKQVYKTKKHNNSKPEDFLRDLIYNNKIDFLNCSYISNFYKNNGKAINDIVNVMLELDLTYMGESGIIHSCFEKVWDLLELIESANTEMIKDYFDNSIELKDYLFNKLIKEVK